MITILVITILIIIIIKHKKEQHKVYQQVSGNSFIDTMRSKGTLGEYKTFQLLTRIPIYKLILTNIYLPKADGTTTEIDLLMICQKGIYVFESKNYSGWIFGDEKRKEWTQTFPNGKKNKFYNPIWQNKVHIEALSKSCNINPQIIYSYIIFSERCTLKKIDCNAPNTYVLNRYNLLQAINYDIYNKNDCLQIEEINSIYQSLVPFTNVPLTVKQNHINQINSFK